MRRLRILFVDSDPTARNKIQSMLENEFVVQCVGSATEAKACLQTERPDILITEIIIGQENGLDLCRYVRATTSLHSLPIMLLTSLATIQDKVAGFEAGTDDYVVKPFDARHLIARIRLLSRIKRIEQHTNI